MPGTSGITPFSVRSFSFGGDRPEPVGGTGAGRFAPRLLTLVKPIDSNTPAFFALATNGTIVNTISVTVPATGISAATYTFTGSSVISDNHSDKGRSASGQELQEVSFSYRRLQVQVGNVSRCFDFGSATAC
jgi:type VI protein secretion system component Hcp